MDLVEVPNVDLLVQCQTLSWESLVQLFGVLLSEVNVVDAPQNAQELYQADDVLVVWFRVPPQVFDKLGPLVVQLVLQVLDELYALVLEHL